MAVRGGDGRRVKRDMVDKQLHVEVAFALRDRQVLLVLEIENGRSVEDVIRRSGILEAFPEIDIARSSVGIFGRVVPLDTRVRDGDRVEIYRPLIADPKELRRRNARRSTPRSRRA